jgi:hypothetical protein
MSADLPLAAGDVLTTAWLSPCVGGLVRTWTGTDTKLWTPDDPAALRDLMGHGILARTEVGPDRYREAALLDADGRTLVLNPRYPSSTDENSVTLEGQVISLRPSEPPEDSGTAIEEYLQYLHDAILHCEESHENLVLELGSEGSPSNPYCLFALQEDDGDVVSILETSPVPTGSSLWPAPQAPDDTGVTVTAPASRDTIDAARLLIGDAMTSWKVAPWDTVLTFWRPAPIPAP